MRIPCSTYRLQFNREFTFSDALEVAAYLRELGVSDLYASPVFQAGAQSTHGYDVCCFEAINPALGGTEAFEQLAFALRQAGMGLLQDMVPNHMGNESLNSWWRDV